MGQTTVSTRDLIVLAVNPVIVGFNKTVRKKTVNNFNQCML